MICLCNPTTVSQLLTRIQDWQNKANSFFRCERILRSCNSEYLWSEPRSQSTLYHSKPQDFALPRFWIAARHTENYGYFRKRLWTTACSRRTNLYSLQQSKEFGNLFSGIETWYSRKYQATGEWNETRTAEFVNTCTTLPKWRWNPLSYWWNLFSRWYDWFVFGIASGKVSWLYGISKLESQLQNWSMFRISRSSFHNATDQRKLR